MRTFITIVLLITLFIKVSGQSSSYLQSGDTPEQTNLYKSYYEDALNELSKMANQKEKYDFKRAVFLTENAYDENAINYDEYCSAIDEYVEHCETLMNLYKIDTTSHILRLETIILLMTKVIFTPPINDTVYIYSQPFKYDFSDYRGILDWSNMFTSKLIDTKTGNCHSLPLFAKTIANEMNVDIYFAYMPNHIYLKFKHPDRHWYTAELTNGSFPPENIMRIQGYIRQEAIENRIYMDKLNWKQEIALCMVDLGKGYQRKFGKNGDDFVMECADKALSISPKTYVKNYYVQDSININVNAMLLKANVHDNRFLLAIKEKGYANLEEFMNAFYQEQKVKGNHYTYNQFIKEKVSDDALHNHLEAAKLATRCGWLGYEEMDEKMYREWQLAIEKEAQKQEYNKELYQENKN